jgi:uncharacterized RDD family membrane protein YckC
LAFCAHCGKELPVGAIVCPYCGTPVPGAAAAPQAPPSQQAQSGPVSGFDTLTKDSKAQDYWFRRVVAFIIDAIIIGVIVVIIGIALFIPFLFFSGTFAVYAIFGGLFSVIAGFLIFLYFIFAEVTRGATIGKSVFHLKVVGPKGGNPTWMESFVRNVSKIYWLLLLLDVIVGLAVSKGYNQKYSDKLVGTSVVQVA